MLKQIEPIWWSATALCILAIIIIVFILWSKRTRTLELTGTSFGVFGQKTKWRVNNDDRQIAYKIWVELSTRKIGIKVDPENDVISEVYNSWYKFFEVTRDLIKEIPISKIKKEETQEIIRLSVHILNEQIRPHLTKWQARFRKWYDKQLEDDALKDLSPQEIQRKFPQYQALFDDLLKVNESIVGYQKLMEEIIGYQSNK